MNIHFIAIGGAVMHQLAICLHRQGHSITGSDDAIYDPSKSRLQEEGLLPERLGFHKDNIPPNTDLVIAGMHAKQGNPELKAAEERNLKVMSFPEFIGKQSAHKKRVVIAGSHGKTSTTAMLLHAMHKLNKKTDYLVGAKLEGLPYSVQLSDAPTILIEGDEYLSAAFDKRPKFLHYHPQVLIVTGIAWDHINVFPTFEAYVGAFKKLIEQLQPGSTLIYFQEDNVLRDLARLAPEGVQTKGYRTPAYKKQAQGWALNHQEEWYTTGIFGEHNLQNAQAAALAAKEIGLDMPSFFSTLATFSGAGKRLECIEENDNRVVIRDFAHAPSKVKASVKAVRSQYPDARFVACLELHTFSSLDPKFLPHYKNALQAADHAIVYLSEEARKAKDRPYIEDEQIHNAFQQSSILVLRKPNPLQETLREIEQQADDQVVFLMMSSGHFDGALADYFRIA